jgi:transaldolase
MGKVIEALAQDGIVLNVTAVMTPEQVVDVAHALSPTTPSIVSVFAGRIADTGVDPVPHMIDCGKNLRAINAKAELLWASPREVLNIYHAEAAGCDIITATPDLLNKLSLGGKDLVTYSLETVQMFRRDAIASGFEIRT